MSVTLTRPVKITAQPELQDPELISTPDPLSTLLWIDPARVSGTVCFAGTRVPLQILWDHLEEGQSIGDFLEGFPGVTQEQAEGVLRLAFQTLLKSLPENTPWR